MPETLELHTPWSITRDCAAVIEALRYVPPISTLIHDMCLDLKTCTRPMTLTLHTLAELQKHLGGVDLDMWGIGMHPSEVADRLLAAAGFMNPDRA